MSDLGKVVVRRIREMDVVCRELTVGQLRGMFSSQPTGDVVADFLFEDLRLSDIRLMSSLTDEQLLELHPTELREVVAACREANPDFFGMLARLAAARRTS